MGEIIHVVDPSQLKKPEVKPQNTDSKSMQMVIMSFKPLYLNISKNADDVCPICKNELHLPCINCEANNSDACPIITGNCNHSYHAHCINKWIETNKTCPSCQAPWSTWYR